MLHVNRVCMEIGFSQSQCQGDFHSSSLSQKDRDSVGERKFWHLGSFGVQAGNMGSEKRRRKKQETHGQTFHTSRFSFLPQSACYRFPVFKECSTHSAQRFLVAFSGRQDGVLTPLQLELEPPYQYTFQWPFLKGERFWGRPSHWTLQSCDKYVSQLHQHVCELWSPIVTENSVFGKNKVIFFNL